MPPELLDLGIVLATLIVAYFIGSALERAHYRSIRSRERRWARLPAVTLREVPAGWEVLESDLLVGNVVVSVDYFKRFLASLRALVGGRIASYETLLDRGRREALLRLKRMAIDNGHHAILNVRLETSRLANSTRREGTAGVEVLAFGTGLKLRKPPS